jgi:hypothetical protein
MRWGSALPRGSSTERLGTIRAWARRLRSGWAAELRAAIALHDFAVAGNELIPSEERREQARLAVVAVLDRARKAGVSEADVDAEIQAYRRQALNTMELLRAVAAVGRERERVARKRGHDVERLHLAWAMMDEIGGRLGVPREELSPLRDHALDTGLLDRVEETATPDPRAGYEQVGWALTPASRALRGGRRPARATAAAARRRALARARPSTRARRVAEAPRRPTLEKILDVQAPKTPVAAAARRSRSFRPSTLATREGHVVGAARAGGVAGCWSGRPGLPGRKIGGIVAAKRSVGTRGARPSAPRRGRPPPDLGRQRPSQAHHALGRLRHRPEGVKSQPAKGVSFSAAPTHRCVRSRRSCGSCFRCCV